MTSNVSPMSPFSGSFVLFDTWPTQLATLERYADLDLGPWNFYQILKAIRWATAANIDFVPLLAMGLKNLEETQNMFLVKMMAKTTSCSSVDFRFIFYTLDLVEKEDNLKNFRGKLFFRYLGSSWSLKTQKYISLKVTPIFDILQLLSLSSTVLKNIDFYRVINFLERSPFWDFAIFDSKIAFSTNCELRAFLPWKVNELRQVDLVELVL